MNDIGAENRGKWNSQKKTKILHMLHGYHQVSQSPCNIRARSHWPTHPVVHHVRAKNPFHDFMIEILWKFSSMLMMLSLFSWSNQVTNTHAHVITAQLSWHVQICDLIGWHVQNCDLIWSLFFKLDQQDLDYELISPLWNGSHLTMTDMLPVILTKMFWYQRNG